MIDVVEILREITKDKVTITISVFLPSGIVRREYVGTLSYNQEEQEGLPYIRYCTDFGNIAGKATVTYASSPEWMLYNAFSAVKDDARRFASRALKNAGMKNRLLWPKWGFWSNCCRVSSW